MEKNGPSKLIIIGGATDVDNKNLSNEVWVLNTGIVLLSSKLFLLVFKGLKSWSKPRCTGDLPPLVHARTASVGQNVFMFGGLSSSGPTSDMYVLNLRTNQYLS